MSTVEDVKNQVDIVEIVSENVKLRRTGKNYIGFCPFHANTHTPSFVVFPDSGTWRCFGQCSEGGDVFSYVMKRDGCDFQTALEVLAKKAGVELTPYTPRDDKPREEKQRLYDLMNEAVDYFHNNLTQHPAGKPALAFLTEKRGLKPETIEKFRLGYALPSWDGLLQHLMAKGFTRQELIDTGVVSEQRDEKGEVIPNGRIYDRFRNRVMIPIGDSRGNPIAFGARILDPNDTPKFLNSPQTVLFDKGKTLFALNEARPAIREKDQVVLVEGYMDVIVLHQEGFSNTVCPMGTALTDFQAKQLTRQTKHIVLALDGDAAGYHAAVKDIDIIREASLSEPVGEGRALLQQENRLNVDIRIVTIPEGLDPDEVVLEDHAAWENIIHAAKPIVIHMMETLAKDRDLNDARTKSEIAAKVMPLIREVPNAIERETYRQQLARFLDIDESLLTYSGQTAASGNAVKRAFPAKPRLKTSADALVFDPKDSFYNKENEILRCLYRYYDDPGSLAAIDRQLRRFHLEALSPADFNQSDLHEISRVYFQALDQDEELDTKAFIDKNIPESVRDVFLSLKTVRQDKKDDMKELDEEIVRSVAFMRQEKCEYEKSDIQSLLEEGEPESENIRNYEKMLDQTLERRRRLDILIENINQADFRK
ncbi:MAG: DNA primase [Anaerolineaceae bacterium]|nr:DNA primase [Anaerolineaceae bacterium]